MTYDQVMESINKKQKGCFRGIEWEKRLPTKKGFENMVVKKISRGVVRFGVEYEHIGSIKAARKSGTLPTQSAGLTWGTWYKYPYFIEHKGNTYLRCTKSKKNKLHSEYYLNGVKVLPESIKHMCLASAFTSNESEVFTLNVENVTKIR